MKKNVSLQGVLFCWWCDYLKDPADEVRPLALPHLLLPGQVVRHLLLLPALPQQAPHHLHQQHQHGGGDGGDSDGGDNGAGGDNVKNKRVEDIIGDDQDNGDDGAVETCRNVDAMSGDGTRDANASSVTV